MGIISAIKNKITHQDEYGDLDDVEATRSQVLGEPMNDIAMDDYVPQSKYATPAAARFNPVRTHNIGPPEFAEQAPPAPVPIAGRRADELMPADRMINNNPMYSPAPAPPFGEPMSMAPQAPQMLTNTTQQNDERIIEKIEYLRQDIKSLQDDIELLTERIKNVQQRVEARKF